MVSSVLDVCVRVCVCVCLLTDLHALKLLDQQTNSNSRGQGLLKANHAELEDLKVCLFSHTVTQRKNAPSSLRINFYSERQFEVEPP